MRPLPSLVGVFVSHSQKPTHTHPAFCFKKIDGGVTKRRKRIAAAIVVQCEVRRCLARRERDRRVSLIAERKEVRRNTGHSCFPGYSQLSAEKARICFGLVLESYIKDWAVPKTQKISGWAEKHLMYGVAAGLVARPLV